MGPPERRVREIKCAADGLVGHWTLDSLDIGHWTRSFHSFLPH